MHVAPGERITLTTRLLGPASVVSLYRFDFKIGTRKPQSFILPCALCTNSSAEVIVEDPNARFWVLPSFGVINFTSIAINRQPFNDLAPTQIAQFDHREGPEAIPGDIGEDGKSFSVRYSSY